MAGGQQRPHRDTAQQYGARLDLVAEPECAGFGPAVHPGEGAERDEDDQIRAPGREQRQPGTSSPAATRPACHRSSRYAHAHAHAALIEHVVRCSYIHDTRSGDPALTDHSGLAVALTVTATVPLITSDPAADREATLF